MKRVVIAGHVCVDLAPHLPSSVTMEPGELVDIGPLTIAPGGSVFNTGSALAALGVRIDAHAPVGDDLLGAIVLDELERHGIGADGVAVLGDAGTSYSVVIEAGGRSRTIWHHLGAVTRFDGTDVLVEDAALVHVGYPTALPALLPDEGAPLSALLQRAKTAGASTSVDMSVVDPRSPAAQEDWNALLASALPHVDIFTPSVDDLVSMRVHGAGRDRAAIADVADRLLALGAAIVHISDGERGAFLRTAGVERLGRGGALLADRPRAWADVSAWIPPERVARVVTTNGAGDTSTAGLLYGILHGMPPVEAAAFAARLAATLVRGEKLESALPGELGAKGSL